MDDQGPAGSMRFSIAERQLKLFKNALVSLGKIGGDLLVEALTGRLVLRTINSARSAYMSVTFDARFFDEYHVFNCTVVQAGLLLKHVLSTFRTQRVSKIVFELKTADSSAAVTLYCDSGLQKSYKIPSMEAEILQATVEKEAFPTCVVAETGAMGKLLSSFSSGLEEVTIIAYGETGRAEASKAVQLYSFLDPLKGHVDKSLFTQLAVDTREVFLSFTHSSDEDADVTFNLKDFKAMLSLCESLNANVMLRFEGPGQPLVVEPHFPTIHGQDVDYEAELILATLVESHSLPRMPENGGQAADAAAGAARGAAGAADSWLAPPAPAHLQHGQQLACASVPRSTGRARGSGRAAAAAAEQADSPVPSGLLDDPFQGPATREGSGAPHHSPSRRSRQQPSRLGMQGASGQQHYAAGGGRAQGESETIGRGASEMDWQLEPSAADEEIPSTPPDEQTDRQEAASALPGVIPTQWAAGR